MSYYVNKIINNYYNDFEVYKWDVIHKLPSFYFFIFFFFGFFISFYIYIENHYLNGFNLIVSVLFEAASLISFFKLQKNRDRVAIENFNKVYGQDVNELNIAKEKWFEINLGVKRADYLNIAKEIDGVMEFREKYKPAFSFTRKQWFDLIYTSDSKPRILTMLVAVGAATIALSTPTGFNINNVFDFISKVSVTSYFSDVFLVSFTCIGLFLGVRFLILLALLLADLFFEKLDGLKSTSNRRVGIFINQLLIFHEIKKSEVECLKKRD